MFTKSGGFTAWLQMPYQACLKGRSMLIYLIRRRAKHAYLDSAKSRFNDCFYPYPLYILELGAVGKSIIVSFSQEDL